MKPGKGRVPMRLSKSDISGLAAMIRLYLDRGWSVEDGRLALERYAEAEAAEAALRGGHDTRETSR